MKTSFFILAILFFKISSAHAGCRSIPAGSAPGKKAQSVTALTGKPSDKSAFELSYLGEDVVYEGTPCAAGKVCIETLFNNRPGADQDVHGQVIVIDKNSGKIDALSPIRFRGTGSKGLPFYNQSRFQTLCQGSNFARQEKVGGPCKNYANSSPLLDIYSYSPQNSSETGTSPFAPIYSPFSSEARTRALDTLNSGNVTKPGEWSQAGSVAVGGRATFTRVARVVGDVRRALGCEPAPSTPRLRITSALNDQAASLAACGLTYDRTGIKLGDGENTTVREIPRQETNKKKNRRGNQELDSYDQGRDFNVPFNCTSEKPSASIEIVTCRNGDLPAINPEANTEFDRGITGVGSKYEPQQVARFKLVDGVIQNFSLERNSTYYSSYKKECTPVAPSENSGSPQNGASSQRR